jgi:hypothetical protein
MMSPLRRRFQTFDASPMRWVSLAREAKIRAQGLAQNKKS